MVFPPRALWGKINLWGKEPLHDLTVLLASFPPKKKCCLLAKEWNSTYYHLSDLLHIMIYHFIDKNN